MTVRHLHFEQSRHAYSSEHAEMISEEDARRARAEIQTWPGYTSTPLRGLSTLAQECGVRALFYKDESQRFDLNSFKGLGGAYGVLRVLQERVRGTLGREPTSVEFLSGALGHLTSGITVTTATDGNHGRAVAWGAQHFGCRCVVYVHAHVSPERVSAIERLGAEVIRVVGNYDDSVRQAQEDARSQGRIVVSDTSYTGYMDVPRSVMAGYTVMVDEALAELASAPTHCFVQSGVGALPAAVALRLWQRLGAARPRLIVVEPTQADCFFRSMEAGNRVVVTGGLDTIMAGLACGEVSLLAWEILQHQVDDCLAIEDTAAATAMRLLAREVPPIVAGESGCAGLAGFLAAREEDSVWRALGLTHESTVLFFGTEGATDPRSYSQIIKGERV